MTAAEDVEHAVDGVGEILRDGAGRSGAIPRATAQAPSAADGSAGRNMKERPAALATERAPPPPGAAVRKVACEAEGISSFARIRDDAGLAA